MTAHLPTSTLPPGYLLRRMRPADTSTTARMHRRLLPNGLFPRLGPRFLRRWHATFLDTPSATGLAVVHHGEVVAFVLATLDQRLYLHHTLRRHRWPLMWRGALGLAVRPHVLVRFLRTRVRAYARHLVPRRVPPRRPVDLAPAGADGDRTDGLDGPGATDGLGVTDGLGATDGRRVRVAVIHAVITGEQARGLGCARALLDTVIAAAQRARVDHIALVTDVPDPADGAPPAGAAAMYETLGWHRESVRHHRDGRWIAEYRLPITAAMAPVEAVAPVEQTPRTPGPERQG